MKDTCIPPSYPLLRFIAAHGIKLAVLIGALALVGAIAFTFNSGSWLVGAAAATGAVLLGAMLASYVERVRVVMQTVAEYNAALMESRLHDLRPVRSTAKGAALPIVTEPFVAIPVCCGITNTMGGLQVDAQARVLDRENNPIAGLHAAGAATGGLEGGPQVHYVGGLMKALVFGLRAAEHAASSPSFQRTRTAVANDSASQPRKETLPR